MRKVAGVLIASVGLALGGTAIASAGDDDDDRRSAGIARGSGLEIEIDPELDARFSPRAVNAVQAAAIVERAFPGARAVEAELDEEDGDPIWEIEFVRAGREDEVDVDATSGAILR